MGGRFVLALRHLDLGLVKNWRVLLESDSETIFGPSLLSVCIDQFLWREEISVIYTFFSPLFFLIFFLEGGEIYTCKRYDDDHRFIVVFHAHGVRKLISCVNVTFYANNDRLTIGHITRALSLSFWQVYMCVGRIFCMKFGLSFVFEISTWVSWGNLEVHQLESFYALNFCL